MVIVASTLVSQAKNEWVGSLGLSGVGPSAAQRGYQLSEGRVVCVFSEQTGRIKVSSRVL